MPIPTGISASMIDTRPKVIFCQAAAGVQILNNVHMHILAGEFASLVVDRSQDIRRQAYFGVQVLQYCQQSLLARMPPACAFKVLRWQPYCGMQIPKHRYVAQYAGSVASGVSTGTEVIDAQPYSD